MSEPPKKTLIRKLTGGAATELAVRRLRREEHALHGSFSRWHPSGATRSYAQARQVRAPMGIGGGTYATFTHDPGDALIKTRLLYADNAKVAAYISRFYYAGKREIAAALAIGYYTYTTLRGYDLSGYPAGLSSNATWVWNHGGSNTSQQVAGACYWLDGDVLYLKVCGTTASNPSVWRFSPDIRCFAFSELAKRAAAGPHGVVDYSEAMAATGSISIDTTYNVEYSTLPGVQLPFRVRVTGTLTNGVVATSFRRIEYVGVGTGFANVTPTVTYKDGVLRVYGVVTAGTIVSAMTPLTIADPVYSQALYKTSGRNSRVKTRFRRPDNAGATYAYLDTMPVSGLWAHFHVRMDGTLSAPGVYTAQYDYTTTVFSPEIATYDSPTGTGIRNGMALQFNETYREGLSPGLWLAPPDPERVRLVSYPTRTPVSTFGVLSYDIDYSATERTERVYFNGNLVASLVTPDATEYVYGTYSPSAKDFVNGYFYTAFDGSGLRSEGLKDQVTILNPLYIPALADWTLGCRLLEPGDEPSCETALTTGFPTLGIGVVYNAPEEPPVIYRAPNCGIWEQFYLYLGFGYTFVDALAAAQSGYTFPAAGSLPDHLAEDQRCLDFLNGINALGLSDTESKNMATAGWKNSYEILSGAPSKSTLALIEANGADSYMIVS